ncbi:DnaJ subfamily C member 3 [Beauveria bassiana D1-5]|uniref:DnaJ subfamily C member 3 n=1 Tax=Beauveria bassiana D1-5 TaxID=1245745 RepID=A0A0A2V449_BEABA|nr:DnaJ subfamily C member 3 [Beauveria bassiana D1-5]
MWFPLSRLAITASVLATATALSAHDIPADLPVSSLLSNAQTHLAKGETSEAILYYDAAIARDPNNYLTIFKRATAFLSIGRANQATDDFNKVLVLKPTFQGAHVQLANLKSKVADWEGAKAEYAAAEKATDSPELVELAGAERAAAAAVAASKNQSWDDCVNHATIAISVASRHPPLRELRSKCLFARGEIQEGMGDLQYVLLLRPGDTSPHTRA